MGPMQNVIYSVMREEMGEVGFEIEMENIDVGKDI